MEAASCRSESGIAIGRVLWKHERRDALSTISRRSVRLGAALRYYRPSDGLAPSSQGVHPEPGSRALRRIDLGAGGLPSSAFLVNVNTASVVKRCASSKPDSALSI